MARKSRNDEVIGRIDPHPIRRAFATGGIGLLGMIVLYLAASFPPADLAWLIFQLLFGAGALYLSWRMWDASAVPLELTREMLREQGGRILCKIEDIASVDRGFFAFKPASGFLIRLKQPTTDRVYAPGLWWRARRTIMVGGVVSGAQAKSVADLISILLVERDAGRGR